MSTSKRMRVGNIDIEVVRKDIKNIHLAVYPPNGVVRLASPQDVKDNTIRLFAISKLGWIRKQQRKYSAYERQSPRQFVQRETHYFLGRRYLLRVRDADSAQRIEISGNRHLDMYVHPDSQEKVREKLLNEWYRGQLKKLIPELLSKWEGIVGVKAATWGVRLMKTKWGTCNIESKRIWLNLELAKKPVSCLEYIICHELVHLLERNHNEKFLAYMNKFMPKWKLYRDELNRLPMRHEEWGY